MTELTAPKTDYNLTTKPNSYSLTAPKRDYQLTTMYDSIATANAGTSIPPIEQSGLVLMQTGDYILMETGDKIILDGTR